MTSASDVLRLFLDHSLVCVCTRQVVPPYALTFVSENVGRVFGIATADLVAHPDRWSTRIHGDDAASIQEELAAVRWLRIPHHLTYRIVDDAGTERWVEETLRWHDSGIATGPALVGSLVDATEHRLIVHELVGSEERYQLAVQGSKAGLWDYDVPRNWFQPSPRFFELLGYGEDASPGVEIDWWFGLLHPEDAGVVRAALTAHLAGQGAFDLECRARRTDGEYRWFHVCGQANFVGEGEPTRVAGWFDDITDRRRLQDQFRQAVKMEAIGRLAAGVAHDFNNLLTAINGYAQLLHDSLSDTTMRDDAHEIILVSNRASALTRQLLAFSRQQVVEPQVVDLDGAIAGVGNMLRRLVGAAVDLRTERRAAGEQVLIRIDPGHLEQVLLNFVVNAKDAMPAGGTIVIATDIVSALPQRVLVGSTTPEPGPFVELSVRDSGVGMDSSTLEKIFEPFFTTKEPGKGTGLGLATVYGIVSQNGGRISVESTPGAGTTFSVYVPRARAADLSAPDHHDALPDGPGHGTILLVEDEEAVRAVARRVLVRAGYRVIDAAKASEALFQARQPGVRIDLLLTDLVMPGVSGERLYDELVAERPRLKVLFMSGYSEQRHVHAGRANFMQKPFSPDVLTARVRAVLHAGDEGA